MTRSSGLKASWLAAGWPVNTKRYVTQVPNDISGRREDGSSLLPRFFHPSISLSRSTPPFPADIFPKKRMCMRVIEAIFLLDYRTKILSSFIIHKYELLYLQYTCINFREIKKTYAKYHFYCALLYVCAQQIFLKFRKYNYMQIFLFKLNFNFISN